MKNYHLRNFLEMLKYMFFTHGGSALFYIFIYSSAEAQYADQGKLDTLNLIFIFIAAITFVISVTLMLTAHFRNSEKKMNYLNSTYEGGNESRIAIISALKEGATVALTNLIFQIPMIIIFFNVGYRYGIATVFETLYICDVGIYIFFKNPIIGALMIAAAYFIIYTLGVFIIISPMWNMGRIRKKGAPIVPDEPEKDAFFRYTFENKYKIFYVLKTLVITNLTVFLISIIFSVVLAAISSEMNTVAASIFFGCFYVIVFYAVHGNKRNSSYFPQEKKFSFAKEARAFFREELVYYIITFIILGIIGEISCFVFKGQNPVTMVFNFLFPFYSVIKLPIVRSVVNIVWAIASVNACAVLKSYFSHRKVSRASKYRR